MSSVSGRVKVEYQNISIKSEHGYVPVKEEDTDDEGGLDLGKKKEDVNVASCISSLKKRKVYDMLEYAKRPVNTTAAVSKDIPSDPPDISENAHRTCSSDGSTNHLVKGKNRKRTVRKICVKSHVVDRGVCWVHGAKDSAKNAATKDVPTLLTTEKFALDMGQRERFAVMKNVPA